MYDKKNLAYVLTSPEAIEKIFIYTKSIKTADDFFDKKDQLIFNACQTLIMVIGEETKKITENLKSEFNQIPWPLIAGLRNRIAHDYRSINPNISFDIIKNYLPQLRDVLIQMVDKIEYEKEKLNTVLESRFYTHLQYLKKD